jgi:acyl-CoA synthetase (AMP-forming)/AMP-acid ligase II
VRNHGVASWIARRASVAPQRLALVFEGRDWTYAQLHQQVAGLAHGLASLGVRRGDRVAYVGPNHPAALQTMFAAATLGAIFVPVNYRLAGAEVAYVVNDAGCDVLVHGWEQAATVASVRASLVTRHYLTVGAPAEGSASLEDLAAGQPTTAIDVPVGLDDVLLLMYTSGTTGRPKGVMLTHGNLTWNVFNVLSRFDFSSDEVTLTFTPPYRLGGMGVTLLETLHKGGTVVLMAAFDPQEVLRLVERHRVTSIFANPDFFAALADVPEWEGADLSSVRFCVVGGSPVPQRLIVRYLHHDIAFLQGYGLTEAGPVALLLDKADVHRKVGSAGLPGLFCDVRVVRPDMTDVARGEMGEIVVRGPNVMKGYWNRPEATDEAITHGGWLHTGDAARVDDEGYVFVVDRMKDVITTGGENVYPAEIERAIEEHPDVAECAVVGDPDPGLGEVPKAFVMLAKGATCTEEDLLRFLDGRVADYKVPKTVRFVDSLPKNPAGKVLKMERRAAAAPAP